MQEKNDISRCMFFDSKCGKTHLRAFVKSKNFRGLCPRTPRKRRKGRAREERTGEWKNGMGKKGKGKGRKAGKKGGEKGGKERAGKWKERELGEVCVMVLGGGRPWMWRLQPCTGRRFGCPRLPRPMSLTIIISVHEFIIDPSPF
jgi:hypothetical protein